MSCSLVVKKPVLADISKEFKELDRDIATCQAKTSLSELYDRACRLKEQDPSILSTLDPTIETSIAQIEELSCIRLQGSRYTSLIKDMIKKNLDGETVAAAAKVPLHIAKNVFEQMKSELQIKLLTEEHLKKQAEFAKQEAVMQQAIAEKRLQHEIEKAKSEVEYQKNVEDLLRSYFEQKQKLNTEFLERRRDQEKNIALLREAQAQELNTAMGQIESLKIQARQLDQVQLEIKAQFLSNRQALQAEASDIQQRLQQGFQEACMVLSTSQTIPFDFKDRQKLVERTVYLTREGIEIPYMHFTIFYTKNNPNEYLLSGRICDSLQTTELNLPPEKILGVQQPLQEKQLEQLSQPDVWNILKDEDNPSGKFFLQYSQPKPHKLQPK